MYFKITYKKLYAKVIKLSAHSSKQSNSLHLNYRPIIDLGLGLQIVSSQHSWLQVLALSHGVPSHHVMSSHNA